MIARTYELGEGNDAMCVLSGKCFLVNNLTLSRSCFSLVKELRLGQ
jgi:hypothetical protein